MIYITLDLFRSIWLTSHLYQTRTWSKLTPPGYCHLTPFPSTWGTSFSTTVGQKCLNASRHYMEGRCAPSATRVPCAMEVRTKCRHHRSRDAILETFLYIMHSVKLQRCSFMTLYVSSTLHTLMDFAKASRLNEANRRYDQWKLELSHVYSSKKATTHTLLQGTRTRRGWYKLLLYVPLHVAPSIRGHRKGWKHFSFSANRYITRPALSV